MIDPTKPALLPGIQAALAIIRQMVRPGLGYRHVDGLRVYEAVLTQAVRIEKSEGSNLALAEPANVLDLLARADVLLHDMDGADESMAHSLVHDAAAFLSDHEEIRANVRAQYASLAPEKR